MDLLEELISRTVLRLVFAWEELNLSAFLSLFKLFVVLFLFQLFLDHDAPLNSFKYRETEQNLSEFSWVDRGLLLKADQDFHFRNIFVEKEQTFLIFDVDDEPRVTLYRWNKKLPQAEEAEARSSLRQFNGNLVKALLSNTKVVWLGVGGSHVDEDHLWAYFHDCPGVEDSEMLSKELFFSGDLAQIVALLDDKICNHLKILYGEEVFSEAELRNLIKSRKLVKSEDIWN